MLFSLTFFFHPVFPLRPKISPGKNFDRHSCEWKVQKGYSLHGHSVFKIKATGEYCTDINCESSYKYSLKRVTGVSLLYDCLPACLASWLTQKWSVKSKCFKNRDVGYNKETYSNTYDNAASIKTPLRLIIETSMEINLWCIFSFTSPFYHQIPAIMSVTSEPKYTKRQA